MNKAWLDEASFGLERFEKTWDDLFQSEVTEELELGPFAMFVFIHLDHMLELLAVEDGPRIFPAIRDLGQLGVARRDMKPEFACW